MQLVAIKVKILRKSTSRGMQNDYPDFNKLEPDVRQAVDWTHFVDIYGGWHYDKISGFGEVDAENPDPLSQYGMLLIPKPFATAAIAAFGPSGSITPGRVEIVEPADYETFHNNRAHAHEQHERVDRELVEDLRAKYGVVGPIKRADKTLWDQEDKDAIDPTKETNGIRKNPRRYAADFLAKIGHTVMSKADAEKQ